MEIEEQQKVLLKWLPILSGVILVGACLIPIALLSYGIWKSDFTKTGQIGDTIGGTIGPAIGMVGALLTFGAFYVQYLANKEQIKWNRIQSKINDDQLKTNEDTRRDILINSYDTQFEKLLVVFMRLKSNFKLNDTHKMDSAVVAWYKEFELYKSVVKASLDEYEIKNKDLYFNVIHEVAITFTINPGYHIGVSDFGVNDAVDVSDTNLLLIEIQNNIKNVALTAGVTYNYSKIFRHKFKEVEREVSYYLPTRVGEGGRQKLGLFLKVLDSLILISRKMVQVDFDNSYYIGVLELELSPFLKNLYVEYLKHYRHVSSDEFESEFV